MATKEDAAYATQADALRTQIQGFMEGAMAQPVAGEVLGVVVPGSNLLRGGPVAAQVFKHVEGQRYDAVIVIAPSHSGVFGRMNICSGDTYPSPLGDVLVNDRVRNELCDEDDDIFLDNRGHFGEGDGIAVQMPFLQAVLADGFQVVPIIMGDESPALCRELGDAIGEVMYNHRTLLVAVSDVEDATDEGMETLRSYIEAGDTSRLMGLLNSEEVKMDGKGALLVALLAVQHRQAQGATVVRLEAPTDDAPGNFGAVLWRD